MERRAGGISSRRTSIARCLLIEKVSGTTECDAVEAPETFFVHDPSGQILFVPGWGQAITRHRERLHERLAAIPARVLACADPDRVNTFCVVTHGDHDAPEGNERYISLDAATGGLTHGDAFLRDPARWEETLAGLIDPLVVEGCREWTSPPEIGKLFVEWEAGCPEDS